jgi:hypothetical protein
VSKFGGEGVLIAVVIIPTAPTRQRGQSPGLGIDPDALDLERRLPMKAYVLGVLLGLAAVSGAIVIPTLAGEETGTSSIDSLTGGETGTGSIDTRAGH